MGGDFDDLGATATMHPRSSLEVTSRGANLPPTGTAIHGGIGGVTASADTRPNATVSDVAPISGFTVRLHAWVSVVFLLVGVAFLIAAYEGIAWPAWLEGSSFAEYVTYGRAMPVALNVLTLGWLTLGLLAALYYFVPRLTGQPIAFKSAASLSGVAIAAGVASGAAAIAMGDGVGGRMLEMPWFSDLLLLAGFLTAAIVISTTVGRSERDRFGVPVWYSIAAPWWLFLSYATGSIPGLTGVDAELQSAFASTAVIGMWVVPASIGLGYALIAQRLPDAQFHPRLGRIGFWSVGTLWAWTAARTLQYGPTADWMETIPVPFAMGLMVAALVVVTDFGLALRGRFEQVTRSTSLGLYAIGTALFLLVPAHMVIQSLRSSSAVVRFTAWESAFDLLTILGAFTFWTAALVGHVVAPSAFRRLGGKVGRWAMLLGVLFAAGTRWVAGLQQGYTWLGGVEADLYPNYGDGFANTVEILHGTDVLTFIGLSVFAIGALLFVIGLGLPLADDPGERRAGIPDQMEFDWPDDERLVTVRRGAVAVFALVVFSVFVMPALDSGSEASLLADNSRNHADGSIEADGRKLYIAEGCWYCHTQQVRAVVTDLGLGAVSVPGDYVYDPPGTLGIARIGPDLTHAGSRAPTSDASWIAGHLADPRAERPWSTMPSYAHLSETQLTALAAYVAGLE